MPEQTIACPYCGKKIPISKAIAAQVESNLKAELDVELKKKEKENKNIFERKLAEEKARIEKEMLRRAKQASAAQIAKFEKTAAEAKRREKALQASFEKRLDQERANIERQAKADAEEAKGEEIVRLRRQFKESQRQVQQLERESAAIARRKDQLDQREKRLEMEIERKTAKMRRDIETETSDRLEKEHHIRDLETQQKLHETTRQLTEVKRKLEQSSQQMQGEVVELELEEVLRKHFPQDEIVPVGKGKLGADILQKIRTPNGDYCATIAWESKSGKTWNNAWLPKMRADQRRVKAEIAVIATVTLPKGIHGFALIDGVWVTEFPMVIALATAFRVNLIQIANLRLSSEGKQEKMQQLFDYLYGTEFRHRVEAIVESFRAMHEDLQKERQSTEKYWAKREKQIQTVVRNIAGMCGEMQEIAGPSFPKIRRLELPSPSDE